MAAGGLGTVGTLIYMIIDSKRRAKQIDTVQKIQSHQLESIYEPDIRVTSWTNYNTPESQNSIAIKNSGEDLIVLGIYEPSGSKILNTEGMLRWFPYHFDKGEELTIPINNQLANINTHTIVIECRNRLGSIYESHMNIIDGKPIINKQSMK